MTGSNETSLPTDSDIDFERIYTSLKNHFYVDIPFGFTKKEAEEVIAAFFAYLQLPDVVKNHIQGTIAPQHRRGDLGYKHRDPNEHIYNDSKDFFHYHPAIAERYSDFLSQHVVVADFMHKAHLLWERVEDTVKKVLRILDLSFPGVYSRVFETPHPHLLLRFLRYHWHSSGEYLAKPHFDAGSFTLAIAESCPGLRIGSCPENLELVKHQSDRAIFMLSSNFQKIMPTNQLSAGWHDVVQLDPSLVGKPFARWAIVAFIEGHGIEALSRSETHKWTYRSL
jgi:hypothetical protein